MPPNPRAECTALVNPSEFDDDLMAELIDLPLAEREAFLQRTCGTDAAMQHRLVGRLNELADFLSSALPTGKPALARSSRDDVARALSLGLDVQEKPGTMIGRYALREKIGEGGCGVVYRAEQQQPVRREVALKLIKLGLDTREFLARFEAERQALALMEHPNIARVFDAGATETGRPYFVMELVRGVPITRYGDENRLPLRDRLQLFISVCEAVQHAHQKGVIHRDLKPSNILVSDSSDAGAIPTGSGTDSLLPQSGVPVPKIIDFGIAKAMGARLSDRTLYTQLHSFIGTPAYTSPEQLEMGGQDLDTRSDVYSLGVLLYELLTGRTPFDAGELARAGLDAMRRVIRETEPPRPSLRLTTMDKAGLAWIASCRGREPARLVHEIRGDLDWIVMKCLEKDRIRRYATANGLAMDLKRHLGNEVVVARPPGAAYRMQKFVRRHKLGVTAAAAVALSLVLGLAAASLLLVRERAAHDRAVMSERAEAELRRQADEARENETIRAGRTARGLAEQFLAQGRTAEGLAWLVHAARKNPRDATLAPRLASALASRRFLVPEAAPLDLGAPIYATVFTEDGGHILVLCEDGTLAAIDATTGQVRRDKLPSPPRSQGITAVHQGWVGVLCRDGMVRVLEQSTAQVVREIRFESRGHVAHSFAGMTGWRGADSLGETSTGPIMLVARGDGSVTVIDLRTMEFATLPLGLTVDNRIDTNDGRWVIASRERSRDLDLWNVTTGGKRHTHSFAGTLLWAVISPDGKRLATLVVADERPAASVALQVWSFPELQPLSEAQVVENMINSGSNRVRFSPDGQWLLTESRLGKHVFSVSSGKRVANIAASGGSVFSRDSRRLMAEATSGLQAFDVATGRATTPAMSHRGGAIRACELSDDGRVMLTTTLDGLVRMWDLETGQLLAEHSLPQPPGPQASLSPDGSRVVIGTVDGKIHRLRLGGAGARPLFLPRNSAGATTAVFLPGAPARLLWFHQDKAKVIAAPSGREIAGGFMYPEPIAGMESNLRGSGVRPDLRAMVVRTAGGEWQAWELGATGVTRVVALEDAPNGTGWIQFSPTGNRVAIVANDYLRQVRFWDLLTGKVIGVPCLHEAPIFGGSGQQPGAFSSDGRRFVAGSATGVVKVWDVETGSTVLELGPMRDALIRFTSFSADDTRIVTANQWGEVQLWDTATGKSVGPAIKHGGSVSTARFSPDGKLLLTSSAVGTTRVWHARDGSPAGEQILHEPSVRSAQLDFDATRVVTASASTTTCVWDAASGQLVAEPMAHPNRLFSATFSPDGRLVCAETVDSPSGYTAYWLWSIPPPLPPGATAPEWLLELATLCANKVIDDAGECVDEPEAGARIDGVRRTLAALADDTLYAEWGRWVLDDRPDRPIAPGFTITPAEAERLRAELAAPRPASR